MNRISTSEKFLCVSLRNTLYLYDTESSQSFLLQCAKSERQEPDTVQAKGIEEGSDEILTSCLSCDGSLVAAADDFKHINIWQFQEGSWRLSVKRDLPRRCTALTFTPKGQKLLLADKSGDVYMIDAMSGPTVDKLTPLMGHTSMLLDLKLCGSQAKLLATCDRDEKIRVSNFPNCYSIQSFCLGHEEFVASMVHVEELQVLLSGSGDGTVRSWDYCTGRQISSIDCRQTLLKVVLHPEESEKEASEVLSLSYSPKHQILAVITRSSYVVVLTLDHGTGDSRGKLAHLTTIELAGPVLGLGFDPSLDCLWCLQVNCQQPLRAFTYSFLNKQLTDAGSDGLRKIMQKFKTDLGPAFEDPKEFDSVFPLLHKVRIDNMTEYMEKKQNRLQKETGKRKLFTEENNSITAQEKDCKLAKGPQL